MIVAAPTPISASTLAAEDVATLRHVLATDGIDVRGAEFDLRHSKLLPFGTDHARPRNDGARQLLRSPMGPEIERIANGLRSASADLNHSSGYAGPTLDRLVLGASIPHLAQAQDGTIWLGTTGKDFEDGVPLTSATDSLLDVAAGMALTRNGEPLSTAEQERFDRAASEFTVTLSHELEHTITPQHVLVDPRVGQATIALVSTVARKLEEGGASLLSTFPESRDIFRRHTGVVAPGPDRVVAYGPVAAELRTTLESAGHDVATPAGRAQARRTVQTPRDGDYWLRLVAKNGGA